MKNFPGYTSFHQVGGGCKVGGAAMHPTRIKGMNAMAWVMPVCLPRLLSGLLCQDWVCSGSFTIQACWGIVSGVIAVRINWIQIFHTVQKVMGGTRVRRHVSGKDGAMVGNQKTSLSSEFMGRIALLEKIHLSWDNFPYYINENANSTLVECSTAHLKHKELTGHTWHPQVGEYCCKVFQDFNDDYSSECESDNNSVFGAETSV